jgi:hypothetical protein
VGKEQTRAQNGKISFLKGVQSGEGADKADTRQSRPMTDSGKSDCFDGCLVLISDYVGLLQESKLVLLQ